MIAPAPTDPDRAARLDETAYRDLFRRLGDVAGTLVLDCGTGLDAPPARAALACADQLVLVTDAEPDTASLVWEAAQRLAHGPPLVLVVNKLDRSSRLDVAALERTIPFARGLVELPQHRAGADQLIASRFSWTSRAQAMARAGARARRAAGRRLASPGPRPLGVRPMLITAPILPPTTTTALLVLAVLGAVTTLLASASARTRTQGRPATHHGASPKHDDARPLRSDAASCEPEPPATAGESRLTPPEGLP